MRKIYLIAFLYFLHSDVTVAQNANNYLFSYATNAVLDPMVGAVNVLTAPNDNTPSGVIPIGFNFNYAGSTYTNLSLSPDGWIRMGSAGPSSQPTNSITNINNTPKIFPFWDDLALGSVLGGGYVRCLLSGLSPNRIFKLEWNVTIPKNTSGVANTKFQVWLYENLGKIEYVYSGTPGLGVLSASVGINGNSASNYLSVTPGITPQASSTVPNNSIITYPATGTKYIFDLPIPACSNTLLSGGVALASLDTVCPNISFQLSVSGYTSAIQASGLLYQWQSRDIGTIAWTDIGGATTNVFQLVNGISVSTEFRFLVICPANNDTVASTIEPVYTRLFWNCYCVPAYVSGCILGDDIDDFILNGVNNTVVNDLNSNCDNPSGYIDHFNQFNLQLGRGCGYNGRISSTFGKDEHVQIWIDVDRSGSFTSIDSVGFIPDVTDTAFLIVLPGGIDTGLTKMRVRLKHDVYDTVLVDACASYTWGETQDYNVRIVPCQAPFGGSISYTNIDSLTLRFGWIGIIGAASFLWDFGDGTTSAEVFPEHRYSSPGAYNVTLLLANMCGSTLLSSTVVVVPTTGVNEVGFDGSDVMIYPNPATQFIVIDNGFNEAPLAIQICNATGQVVLENNNVPSKCTLPIDRLPSGLYTMHLLFQKRNVVRKFIVDH